MEEKGLVKRSSLENIAEAIRTQLGTDEQFTPDNMDEAILRIQSGGAVESVNGQTGAVVLTAEDVGAGTYSKPSDGIPASDLASGVIPTVPTKTSELTNDSGFITSAPEEVFWCTYGTTTSAEIEAAYQAGKMCYCKMDTGVILPIIYPYTATYHIFSAAYNTTMYIAICNNSTWTKFTKQLAEAGNIPDSADDVGAVAADQGVANAGKFMVVGSDGVVAPVAMSTWQGGNY